VITLALPNLFDRVVARFAAEGTNVPMTFGWLAPFEQLRTNQRITWVPGDESGSLGTIGAPKYPGGQERQLSTLYELCTLHIVAFDPAARSDERAQYQMTRELFDALSRAIYLEAHGTYKLSAAKWVQGDRVLRAGASIRVLLELQAPNTDTALTTETVAIVGASIDDASLDVTETVEVHS
jgi:hypothetical protein